MLAVAVVMYGIAASHTTIVMIGALRGTSTTMLAQAAVALGVLQVMSFTISFIKIIDVL